MHRASSARGPGADRPVIEVGRRWVWRRRCLWSVAGAVLWLAGPAAQAQPELPRVVDFETPPELAAASLLPPALRQGADYKVSDPVHSDGLMRVYTVESRFGTQSVRGRYLLAMRIREIQALATLEKTSKAGVVAGTVGRAVSAPVQGALSVAAHPVATVTGIPRGMLDLLDGYRARAEESAVPLQGAGAGTAAAGGASASRNAARQARSAARRFTERYLPLSSAERAWYARLGVDPYTDDAALRAALRRAARFEAATRLGLRFAPLPAIPGLGDVNRITDTAYRQDPALLRWRERRALASLGLQKAEIAQFQRHELWSPTHQTQLVQAVATLPAVEGRAELIRRALAAGSPDEVQALLESVGVLLIANRAHAVTRILGGAQLPTAEIAPGRVMVCAAFEAIYWTPDVAHGERRIREAIAGKDGAGREVWVGGEVSERARRELEQSGWEVHDRVAAD